MPLPIDLRIVGIYAFFPDEILESLDENATIENILDEFQSRGLISYRAGVLQTGKPKKVLSFSYNLTDATKFIPNAAAKSEGVRQLRQINPSEFADAVKSENLGGDADSNEVAIWQYYRSTVIKKDGVELDVRNQTVGQPSYSVETISNGQVLPDGWDIVKYRLVWRLVTIDLKADRAKEFEDAYIASLR